MKQILEGPDFSKTTYEFQIGQMKSMINFMNNIPDFNKRDELITYFNSKSTDWKIGTNGYRSGYGYPFYYKGTINYAQTTTLDSPH